jgi:cytochrome o ubiquinol oxidase operon protein cyoD
VSSNGREASQQRREYARELRQYCWGYGLALLLTLVPFGLVNWSVLPHYGLYLAIGAAALVQVVIHFRCFLHIDPPRQNVDDLHLILFSSLLLFFMVAGTIWILASLAVRTG